MPQTILRFSRWLLVGALFLAIGGHWAVLQTVAWASMIVDYSRTSALTEAVEKTFDGKHPCGICTVIQRTRQSEKKHDACQVVKKVELFDHKFAPLLFPAPEAQTLAIDDLHAERRAEAPCSPPPRAA